MKPRKFMKRLKVQQSQIHPFPSRHRDSLLHPSCFSLDDASWAKPSGHSTAAGLLGAPTEGLHLGCSEHTR